MLGAAQLPAGVPTVPLRAAWSWGHDCRVGPHHRRTRASPVAAGPDRGDTPGADAAGDPRPRSPTAWPAALVQAHIHQFYDSGEEYT